MPKARRIFGSLLLALGGGSGTCSYVANTATTINEGPKAWASIVEAAKGAQAMVEAVATSQVLSVIGMAVGFGGALLVWTQPYLAGKFPRMFGWFPQPRELSRGPRSTAAPTLAMQAGKPTAPEPANGTDNLPAKIIETDQEKAAKHHLVMFAVEQLLPAISTQKSLQQRLLSIALHNNQLLVSLANRGIICHDHYMPLHEAYDKINYLRRSNQIRNEAP